MSAPRSFQQTLSKAYNGNSSHDAQLRTPLSSAGMTLNDGPSWRQHLDFALSIKRIRENDRKSREQELLEERSARKAIVQENLQRIDRLDEELNTIRLERENDAEELRVRESATWHLVDQRTNTVE